MKNIAVIIYSFTIEYSLTILNGIAKFYENKDVHLVISQVKRPHCTAGLYEYQYWAAAELLKSKEFDAMIIVSGSFSSVLHTEEFINYLKKIRDIPIISISADLGIKNNYYTKTESAQTYVDVVSHLKNKHGCKKIAFISAAQTASQEGQVRLKNYKDALKANNLEFREDFVINSEFTSRSAYNAFITRFNSKDNIEFDAILASNDLMAIGAIKALKEFGVKIPQDVKVIGFDDTSYAYKTKPKLSTINQNIFEQGIIAAELAWEKLNGHEIPKVTSISVNPIYRQSCGCISMDCETNIYMDEYGSICESDELFQEKRKSNGDYFNFLSEIDNIYTLFDLVKSESTLKNLSFDMPYLMDTAQLDAIQICLLDQPVKYQRNDSYKVPYNMNLNMYINKNDATNLYEPQINFNPQKTLLLNKYFKDTPGTFILQPLFSGPTQYGYMLCKLSFQNFAVYSIILKILTNYITQSYEYNRSVQENVSLQSKNEELTQNNVDLSQLSTTDELTKILNRRGFFDLAQRSIDMAIEMNASGLVFFADLDGLKKINDTYGHKMGDKAIKAMASVFTKVLRANDIVGRLSGDEFAAITVGMTKDHINQVRDKLKQACKKESKIKKFPFVLSCSIGVTEFNSKHKNLSKLLTAADEQLYIEKNQKKTRK